MRSSQLLVPAIARITREGFAKRTGQILTKNLTDDVLGWVGLNTASRHLPPGYVEVHPVIGIRHQGVEKLVAELRGETAHRYVQATVSKPLRYLMPEAQRRIWVVDGTEADPGATDLAAALAQFGMPFMEAGSSLAALCSLISDEVGHPHQLIYRHPVAWELLGDRAQALTVLASAEAGLGDRSDPAAEEFRAFAVAFRAKVNS